MVKTCLNPTIISVKAVIRILSAPTWIGVKPIKDFLIRINELPQIKESIIK